MILKNKVEKQIACLCFVRNCQDSRFKNSSQLICNHCVSTPGVASGPRLLSHMNHETIKKLTHMNEANAVEWNSFIISYMLTMHAMKTEISRRKFTFRLQHLSCDVSYIIKPYLLVLSWIRPHTASSLSLSFPFSHLLQASERRPINSLCRPFVWQQRLPALVARPDALTFEEVALVHDTPAIWLSVPPRLKDKK